jgi:Zn ribbon nucleic-acid-binding protein
MTDSTAIPAAKCPKCGYFMDATCEAYNYGGRRPRPGDISMCLGCGYASIFNDDLTRREPTKEEALTISLLPEVMKAQIARAQLLGDKLIKK